MRIAYISNNNPRDINKLCKDCVAYIWYKILVISTSSFKV